MLSGIINLCGLTQKKIIKKDKTFILLNMWKVKLGKWAEGLLMLNDDNIESLSPYLRFYPHHS